MLENLYFAHLNSIFDFLEMGQIYSAIFLKCLDILELDISILDMFGFPLLYILINVLLPATLNITEL